MISKVSFDLLLNKIEEAMLKKQELDALCDAIYGLVSDHLAPEFKDGHVDIFSDEGNAVMFLCENTNMRYRLNKESLKYIAKNKQLKIDDGC